MTDKTGLEASEAECAAVAVAPRVSLDDIKAKIDCIYRFTMREVVKAFDMPENPALNLLSICVLVMRSGYTVVGKSACASPENFNAELGANLAYEDAIRQLWPLEGYLLRSKLSEAI